MVFAAVDYASPRKKSPQLGRDRQPGPAAWLTRPAAFPPLPAVGAPPLASLDAPAPVSLAGPSRLLRL